MTAIRMFLSDYDIKIVFKKRSTNTNTKALYWIKLKSDTLKDMIASETEQNILLITHSMIKQNKKAENKGSKYPYRYIISTLAIVPHKKI